MEKKIDNEQLINPIDEEQKKPKPKKRGPQTVVVQEAPVMQGDPLALNATPTLDPYEESESLVTRVKKKSDIQVKRYNPDYKVGLTIDDVEQRQLAGLTNNVEIGSTKTIGNILFTNLFTFFNLLTFAIGIWLWTIGEWTQTVFILIVSANIAIGIFQEIKAKKMIDKLALLSAPTANVIRDGSDHEISIKSVVIDDIVYLSSGKQIIADAVVVSGTIEVDESLLTGESDPIIKKEGDTLYSGSFVISGTCYSQATAVGKDIYVNQLTDQAKVYKKPKSALLKSLKTIIRVIGVFILPIGFGLFWSATVGSTEGWQGIGSEQYHRAVVSTAGAIIGMIPSGLFLLTSVALAVGVIKLAKNNALVQELYCIEMLARVDTLCLDKTGTITDGTMTVKSIIEYSSVQGLTLKNLVSAILNAQGDHNLTSQALADRFGLTKTLKTKHIIPFSSSRKYLAVQFEKNGTFGIGAPEFIYKKKYASIAAEVEKQAQLGYRVLAVVKSNEELAENEITGELTLIALIMIEDTIRPDAVETINYFKLAGVDVKVISGDNPITVSRISERAGITNAHNYISLEGLTDKEVIRAADKYHVFGRVNPQQKKLLVESLKNAGRTVAMTGDGVNDILALKEADTSIAMASGSEAARNVSHLVLLDSNFSSMPKVVLEGRRVINNIEKVTSLFLTKTVFTLLLSLISLWNGNPYPIQPVQLNIIELFAIGIPSIILALEANGKIVQGRFLWNVIKNSLPGALAIVVLSLIVFGLAGPLGFEYEPTVVQTLIVLTATFTSFMVLLKISLPFNNLRRGLFFSVTIMAVMVVLLAPNVFNFAPFWFRPDLPNLVPLTLPQILLLIVLMQASFPLMYIISNMYRWAKMATKKVVDQISRDDL